MNMNSMVISELLNFLREHRLYWSLYVLPFGACFYQSHSSVFAVAEGPAALDQTILLPLYN